jgi:hypothetical protein
LEAVMAGKQFGQKNKRSGKQQQQEGNLGQKEVRREKDKEAEPSRMGQMSRNDERRKGERPSK